MITSRKYIVPLSSTKPSILMPTQRLTTYRIYFSEGHLQKIQYFRRLYYGFHLFSGQFTEWILEKKSEDKFNFKKIPFCAQDLLSIFSHFHYVVFLCFFLFIFNHFIYIIIVKYVLFLYNLILSYLYKYFFLIIFFFYQFHFH